MRRRGIVVALLGLVSSAGEAHASPIHGAPNSRPAAVPPAFYGSCSAFRNDLWPVAQRTSELLTFYWHALQGSYNGNYPTKSGGSTPGPTLDQFRHAQAAMRSIRAATPTLERRHAVVNRTYGIDIGPRAVGPFHWASFKVFDAIDGLDAAAQAELKGPGQGFDYYRFASANMRYAWEALIALPCPSRPTLPVSARVIPSTMPSGAYPLVRASSRPGARCSVDVVYDTRLHPLAFHGETQVADRGGKVTWRWHEMTTGKSGRVFVTCGIQTAEGSAMARFTVTH